MDILYKAVVTSTGGRDGAAKSNDGLLEVKLAPPKELGGTGGATNPEQAAEGTIRKTFALSIGENSVHGSDAPETAAQEIKYWFADTEIVG